MPSSTRSTRAASPTATATAPATCPALTGKLPYLRDLGVDAIWLSPFYTSPLADGGYDVADYRDVDPRFGTLADFDEMIDEGPRARHPGHRRPGAQPLLQRRTPGSRRRWRRPGSTERAVPLREAATASCPNDWESIFGGPAWTRVADGQWYLHLFDPAQPDLNWENPEVRAEFLDMLRFWLDRGVDGFRIDVAHGMIKADGLPDVGRPRRAAARSSCSGSERLPYFDQDGVHDIYREWRPILDAYPAAGWPSPRRGSSPPQRLARYIGRDELHQAFNFDFMMADFDAKSFRTIIDKSLAEADLVGAPTTWVLSNHDKYRHVTRYGDAGRRARRGDPADAGPARLGLPLQRRGAGPRRGARPARRAARGPGLPAHRARAATAAGCRCPGAQAESGLEYTRGCRSPRSGTRSPPQAQETDPDSTLNFYRAALRLRRGFSGGMLLAGRTRRRAGLPAAATAWSWSTSAEQPITR